MKEFDLIILGAGASGLIAAGEAKKNGLKILILDHANKAGLKLSISGGGKANFTNLNMGIEHYHSQNPAFAISALKRCPPEDILHYFSKGKIGWEKRQHGQVFSSEKAERLRDLMLNQAHGCEISLSDTIKSLGKNTLFKVSTAKADYSAKYLLLALGSPAYPQIGGSDLGFQLAKKFGHRVIPAHPALSGLIIKKWPFTDLAGLSLPVKIKIKEKNKKISMKEIDYSLPLLFTHTGISGPAVLQASLLWEQGEIEINFLPEAKLDDILMDPENGKIQVHNLLKKYLPDRFVNSFLSHEYFESFTQKRLAEVPKKIKVALGECLHSHRVRPEKSEGMKRAEVAKGGVSTEDISSQSMESRLMPGLFFAGEILDMTGRLGGYNLHWAFASGLAAAKGIVKSFEENK